MAFLRRFSVATLVLSNSVAVSPDGRTFATGSRDGIVKLWHPYPVAGSSYIPFPRLTWAAFSPDGTTIAVAEQTSGSSGGLDGGVAFYNLKDKSYKQLLPHHRDYIEFGEFSPDGRRLVTVSQGTGVFQRDGKQLLEPPMVMLWNASELELIAPLKDHTDRVNSATFSFDSTKLLTTSNDGSVRLWDVASGTLLSTISGHGGIVTKAIFSPDSARIVTVSNDRTARLWDLGGKLVKVLEGHTGEVRHVAVSPDGSLVATGSDDFSVRVWHAHQGTLSRILSGHGGGIQSVFSPTNNRIISTSTDGTVRLWDLQNGQALVLSDRRNYNGGAAAVSDDGTLVSMSWGNDEVRVFETASGKLVRILENAPVRAVSAVRSALSSTDGDEQLRHGIVVIAGGRQDW